MKYIKTLGIIIIPTFILGILYTTIYYFDLINNNIYISISIITFLLNIFIATRYLGKNSKNKGWLEGLKIGLILSSLFCVISYLGFNILNIKNITYYIVIILISMLGSMFGIKNVKVDN